MNCHKLISPFIEPPRLEWLGTETRSHCFVSNWPYKMRLSTLDGFGASHANPNYLWSNGPRVLSESAQHDTTIGPSQLVDTHRQAGYIVEARSAFTLRRAVKQHHMPNLVLTIV